MPGVEVRVHGWRGRWGFLKIGAASWGHAGTARVIRPWLARIYEQARAAHDAGAQVGPTPLILAVPGQILESFGWQCSLPRV